MMRRPKRSKEADEDASHAPAQEADGRDATDDNPMDEQADQIEARLAPIEEFRSKSDSWMKETSTQLARISTHVQQDEKRQTKLDDRLAEFEDRLQAMLQLTEALGMDQNPFVAGRQTGHAPPGASAGPAADPRGKTLESRLQAPLRKPDDDENVLVIPTDGEGYVGRPAPRSHAHPNDATAEGEMSAQHDPDHMADGGTPPEPRPPLERGAADDRDEYVDASDNPFFTGPSTLVPAGAESDPTPAAPERLTPPSTHDAQASDARPPAAPTPRSVSPGRPRPGDHSADPDDRPAHAPDDAADTDALGPSAARNAERRLAFLQVAGLLARHLRPMDIDPFLECYAHTGWVDHRDVTKIRTLANDLSRNRREPVQRIDREELHMRSILLMSRIAASFERRAPRELDRLAEDRQRIAKSDWMADTP